MPPAAAVVEYRAEHAVASGDARGAPRSNWVHMLVNFGMVLRVLLVVGAIYWCAEIVSRFREDVQTLKTSDEPVEKFVTVLLWGVTALIALWLANALWGSWRILYDLLRG